MEIPQAERDFVLNKSIIKFELNVDTLQNRDKIFDDFRKTKVEEYIQSLDNGTVIFCQDKFGGNAIVSEFTCGLDLCNQIAIYFHIYNLNIHNDFIINCGGDDYHSGGDIDYHIRFENLYPKIKIIQDRDFDIEVIFDAESFWHNYFIFEEKIYKLFLTIYPELKNDDRIELLHKKYRQTGTL
jgi:hypothetical protein